MFRILSLFTLLAVSLGINAQSAIGLWESTNEETGKVESHIEVFERNGKLFGKIKETFTDRADKVCKTCSGDYKNKPYVGMEIITNLKADGKKEWNGGKIYDPKSDNSYKCIIWLEDDPNTLYVRGKHWTGIYRTVTWSRHQD